MNDTAPDAPGGGPAQHILRADEFESAQDLEKCLPVVAERRVLHRAAALVASAISPLELFGAAAAEVGRILQADYSSIVRYESDNTVTVVGHWSDARVPNVMPPLDGRWSIEPGTVTAVVLTTARPARMTGYETCGCRKLHPCR